MDRYPALICDLDGVVYRGPTVVAGAARTLAAATDEGVRVAFATNNASREPSEVMAHLARLGIERPERAPSWSMSVITSAEAAAQMARDQIGPGEPVLAVGGPGVVAALRGAQLTPFRSADRRRFPVARAVVQGAGPDVSWRDLAEAAFRIQAGARWIVTNGDRTIPTGRGCAPGNGALAAAVRAAVDVDPLIAGKPEPALYELALARLGLPRQQTLVIGDRLDTDVAGALRLGLDSMWVLGGAHGIAEVINCSRTARPTYVGVDLRALLLERGGASGEGSTGPVAVDRGQLRVPGMDRIDPQHRLHHVVHSAWSVLDRGGDLPRHPEAWRDLETRVVRDWARWWEVMPPP